MESGRLVIDGSIEVRAFRSHSWPSGRTQTPKDRFGDNVGGVIRTDKTRGEARQIFSMLPVQLGISNISNPHNHKMPQNPSLGDIPSELFVLGHTTSSWIQLERSDPDCRRSRWPLKMGDPYRRLGGTVSDSLAESF